MEETVIAVLPQTEQPPQIELPHDAISKIAYSYWEARGFQPGNPLEDWLRAESEYQQRAM